MNLGVQPSSNIVGLYDCIVHSDEMSKKPNRVTETLNRPVPTWKSTLAIAVSTIVGIVGVYFAAISHLQNDLDSRVKNQVSDEMRESVNKIGKMAEDIAEIKGELTGLTSYFEEQLREEMKKTVKMNREQLRDSLPAINKTVAAATNAKIPADPNLVAQAGERILDLAAKNGRSAESTEAWNTSLALVNYRSVLNAQSIPALGALVTVPNPNYANYKVTVHFLSLGEWNAPPSNDILRYMTILRAPGTATPESSARIESLNLPQSGSTGASRLVLQIKPEYSSRIAILLDDQFLKNVVIRDSLVMYGGGRIRLENIAFINCRFAMLQKPAGVELASAILSQGPSVSVGPG